MNAWTELGRGTTIFMLIVALLIGIFIIYRSLRKKRAPRPIFQAVLTTIVLGTWFTVLEIFRRLRELSLIDETLWWFLIAATLLLMGVGELQERLARKKD